MIKIHKAITTLLGLGYSPVAPGTIGTLGTLGFVYLIMSISNNSLPIFLLPVIALISIVIGIFSTNKVIPLWGDDPSKVVIDEFAGYLITLTLVPLNEKHLFLGLLLFRFFDILKPLGVGYLDKNLKGGLGVMMDDVLAGVYACACLHLIIFVMTNYFG